ncbi:MAG: hypothetical protein OXT67_00980 [Zetaproteobacteria bacterium]|nr:hypothetical protein [Zetaproteobacteria bacterium]
MTQYHQNTWFPLIAGFFLLGVGCRHHNISWPSSSEALTVICPSTLPQPPKPDWNLADAWDPETLANKRPLQQVLRAYHSGKVGFQAKNVRLSGLTPPQVHKHLVDLGFRHHRTALKVHPKQPDYWLKNGETSAHLPTKEQQVPMDIYDHPDGSVIRMKAWGIPDRSGKTLRPQPHLNKTVMFNSEPECTWGLFNCHLNTSWENEAFKVSDEGTPLPKSPASQSGMNYPRSLAPQQQETWIHFVMSAAHIDMPSRCSPSLKAPTIHRKHTDVHQDEEQ